MTTRHQKRYYARRAYAHALLGGKCVRCGTTENLQLDHIDPSTKRFDVMGRWSAPRAEWEAELTKCQLLCRPHHEPKIAAERKARKTARAVV